MSAASSAMAAIVLCGGRGQRMGGADKPLMKYRGKPIIAHICGTLRGSVAAVLISANRNLARYQRYGEVVPDELADCGPLAGLASCLKHCKSEITFACPGDAPNLDPALIERLARGLDRTSAMVCVAHDGQRRQNLHLAMRTGVGADLDAYLASGGRSVQGWLERTSVIDVDCSDLASCFADLDEPGDLG